MQANTTGQLSAAAEPAIPGSRDVHVGFWPQCIEHLILGDEPSRMLNQITQNIKSLGRERHTLVRVPEAVVYSIQPE